MGRNVIRYRSSIRLKRRSTGSMGMDNLDTLRLPMRRVDLRRNNNREPKVMWITTPCTVIPIQQPVRGCPDLHILQVKA